MKIFVVFSRKEAREKEERCLKREGKMWNELKNQKNIFILSFPWAGFPLNRFISWTRLAYLYTVRFFCSMAVITPFLVLWVSFHGSYCTHFDWTVKSLIWRLLCFRYCFPVLWYVFKPFDFYHVAMMNLAVIRSEPSDLSVGSDLSSLSLLFVTTFSLFTLPFFLLAHFFT